MRNYSLFIKKIPVSIVVLPKLPSFHSSSGPMQNYYSVMAQMSGNSYENPGFIKKKVSIQKKITLQTQKIPKSWTSEEFSALPEKICAGKAEFSLNFRGYWALEKHKICIDPQGNFLFIQLQHTKIRSSGRIL